MCTETKLCSMSSEEPMNNKQTAPQLIDNQYVYHCILPPAIKVRKPDIF